MIRKIDIVAIMTVGLMAGGCTQTDDVQPGESVPIRLTATVDGSRAIGSRTATRSGSTSSTTQDTELLEGQTVDAYIREKGGGWLAQPAACTVDGTEGDLTYSGDIYYPMDATPVEIYAVHPSYTSAATFTVSSDQRDADNYAASDLCYSKTAEYSRSESAQTLVFSHVLSKIVVNVDMSALGGSHTVSNLRLKAKTQTTMTYPADNANGYTLGTAATPASIAMNEGGAVVIPPQTTAADGDVRITFDVSGIGPIVYEFPASTEFASNTQYTYTVKVGNTVTVTSSITAWGSQVNKSMSVEIGRPKLPIEYVGEHNMASATAMAEDDNVMNSAYFYWGTNNSTPSENVKKFINGSALSGYHLPSKLEWCSIIPPESGEDLDPDIGGDTGIRLEFRRGVPSYNLSERIAWGVTNNNTSSTWSPNNYSYEVDQIFYNDYNCPNDGLHDYIGYALRFKEKVGDDYVNGRYTCAFRYEYISSDPSVGNSSLLVKVKYVGSDAGITLSTLNDEDTNGYWSAPDFTIRFPACSLVEYDFKDHPAGSFSTSLPYQGIGYYWSASVDGASNLFHMCFNKNRLYGNRSYLTGYSTSVRLFKDAE